MKKIIALVCALTFACAPVAYAEITDGPTVATDTPQTAPIIAPQTTPQALDVSVPATTTVDTSTSSNKSTDLVQGTASSSQTGVTVSDLERTANPITDVAVDASSTVSVDVATTTNVVTVPIVDAPPADPVLADIPMPPAQDLNVVAENIPEATSTEPVQLSNAALNAMLEPQYVFAVTGTTIPTKKKGIIGVSTVAAPADVTVSDATSSNSSTHVLHVTGSCAKTYYVVLLFKNQTDYDTDPGSYLLNRAYPCVNGAYSYNIDDLPTSIKNGTYYLLIGEQGDTGSWSPITGLAEISINRSN